MLHILLLVLKIIGIVLLTVVGILLAVTFAVLFVPLRYRVTGSADTAEQTYEGCLKLTWFLHLITIELGYDGKELFKKIRVLGIWINRPKKDKPTKKRVRSDRQNEAPKEAYEIKQEAEESREAPVICTDQITENDYVFDENIQEEPAEEIREETEEEKSGRRLSKIKKLYNKAEHFLRKIRREYIIRKKRLNAALKKLSAHKEFLEDKRTEQAIAKCFYELKRILHNMRIRKFKADLQIGLEDPAAMGSVLAVMSILYPLFGKGLFLTPYFDRNLLKGYFLIKGHMTAFVAIRAGVLILFNKNCRYSYHRFRELG